MKGGRLAMMALALLAVIGAAQASPPPPEFEARYQLQRVGITLGEAHLQFRRPFPERYDYRLHTRATGPARLVVRAEVEESSRGRITEQGFRPDVYRYQRRGDDDEREAELRFNWARLQVVNDIEDYPWRMDITPDTIDRVISPLQLMHDLGHREGSEDRLVYQVADGGELRAYTLHIEGYERVSTPAGEFEALRIRRQDPDRDRYTLLWCAPSLHYLAVQIEQHEDDSLNVRMRLAEVEGLGGEG
ncbi:DUF3108 domain-containing protein [Spiribacter sp. 2438]|uniref:DUF3108 domain-containing protein n=1 Tax=Spiribacter sp. 2438 TaxID=2666185 RepID=UPI0012AFE7A2|nr:DUF3108 domain-containing protein [Spiribacter sp. 2438]QGM21248.1 DUF3108 domain-containing protein [Spiribacter sp. 2438]